MECSVWQNRAKTVEKTVASDGTNQPEVSCELPVSKNDHGF